MWNNPAKLHAMYLEAMSDLIPQDHSIATHTRCYFYKDNIQLLSLSRVDFVNLSSCFHLSFSLMGLQLDCPNCLLLCNTIDMEILTWNHHKVSITYCVPLYLQQNIKLEKTICIASLELFHQLQISTLYHVSEIVFIEGHWKYNESECENHHDYQECNKGYFLELIVCFAWHL